VAGTVTANAFQGDGAGLTAINGNHVSSGTIPQARIDAAIARDSEIFPTVLANDGSGSGLDADRLDGLDATAFWTLAGNSGTTPGTHFLGTTDNQPLELKVNNQRAFRLEYATDGSSNPRPNVIGGYGNTISTYGSVVGGGNANDVGTNSWLSAIGGGSGNTIGMGAQLSTIGGGYRNTIRAYQSIIGGGANNTIMSNSIHSTIGGGAGNLIGENSPDSAGGGGSANRIGNDAVYATIPGGQDNFATNYAFATGRRAKANHTGAMAIMRPSITTSCSWSPPDKSSLLNPHHPSMKTRNLITSVALLALASAVTASAATNAWVEWTPTLTTPVWTLLTNRVAVPDPASGDLFRSFEWTTPRPASANAFFRMGTSLQPPPP